MNFLRNLPWRRIIAIVAGAAGTFEAVQGALPPWAGMVGAGVIGLAVNAERVMAKRERGDKPFDSRGR